MSIMDQIDPPWQTANRFVLFNAFEAYIYIYIYANISILLSGVGEGHEGTSAAARMCSKQTERNN